MCSELFRIPYEWGGVPLFGAGLLLVVWILSGTFTLIRLVRAHGWSSEVTGYLPIMFLGCVAIWLLPRIFPGGLPIRGYGVMVVIGAAAGVSLACHRAEQVGVNRELILSLALWLFVCGIVGARLFYVIEYWETDFRGDDWGTTITKALNFPQGGLVVYGAFLGAVLAFVVFVRRHELPMLAMADLIAPSLMIGLMFGRIGCLLNGCCYGGACDLSWAVTFPPGSPPYEDQLARGEVSGFRLAADAEGAPVVARVDERSPAQSAGLRPGDTVVRVNGQPVATFREAITQMAVSWGSGQPLELGTSDQRSVRLPAPVLPARSRPVHPTQIYSAVNSALIAWLLWAYYPFRRRDGEVIALLLTIYPVTRFLLEIIRIDESAVFGTGLSISQNISLAVVATAAGMWLYLRWRPAENLAFFSQEATHLR